MDPDVSLRRLLEEEWSRAAAEERGLTRRLREQAVEESTLVGVLLDATESGVAVGLRTTAGRAHQGTLRGVGADFCALTLGSGRWVYVALAAIASVRVEAGVRPGDASTRAQAADRTLAEALAHVAAERPRVLVCTGPDPQTVVGELRAVGADVLHVRLDGPLAGLCHVRLASVTEVVIDPG